MKKILIFSVLLFLFLGFTLSLGAELDLKITTEQIEKPSPQSEVKLNLTIENLGMKKII